MNQKVTKQPDLMFTKWALSKGINTKLLYNKGEWETEKGFVFEDYTPNLFHLVYERAMANPKLEAFEDEVTDMEFNLDRVRKPNQVLYKNDWTRKAYELWQVVCGYQEAIKEGRIDNQLNKQSEVSNHE